MRLVYKHKIVSILTKLLLVIVLSLGCDKEHYLEGSWTFSGCNIEVPYDTYKYPLTPYSPDWANYSIEKIWQINQLPKEVINRISTVGLIETCLTFPYYIDLVLIDHHQYAFDYMVTHFNGFSELLKRTNTANLIYERYQFMKVSCTDNNWPTFLNRGTSIGQSFIIVEMILAQYAILEKFSSDQLSEILEEALNKYNQKVSVELTRSTLNIKFTLAICGRILKILNYHPFIKELEANNNLSHFLDQIDLIDNDESLEIIKIYVQDFLNSQNY